VQPPPQPVPQPIPQPVSQPAPTPATEPAPQREAGYAGLELRDTSVGAVVSAVQPGPLGGDGIRSATLWRGDLIVSVNGQPASASGWQQLVAALPPGSQVTVVYRRSRTPDPAAAVPVPDAAGDLLSTTFSLDAASRWRGTFGGPRRSSAANPEAQEGEFEREIMGPARTRPGDLG
jgi:hypothetical protein